MSRYENTTTPIAYAIVAKDDDGEDSNNDSRGANRMAVEMNAPNVTQVAAEFRHIPEARDLVWNDPYFEDDDDVVAVFDLNYENMENYYTALGWVAYGSTFFCPTIFWTGFFLGVPCLLRPNVQWHVRSQHVAITRDGIRIVRERRPTCWGLSCTDAGKSSRTIPFDQITDCDIVEPAGNTCLCIVNTLHQVHVDTASSSPSQNSGQHDLTIAGLNDPQAFKKLVWAMKRAYHAPPRSHVLDRGLAAVSAATSNGNNNNNGSSDDVAALLRDIRDELRQHNEALRGARQGDASTDASSITASLV